MVAGFRIFPGSLLVTILHFYDNKTRIWIHYDYFSYGPNKEPAPFRCKVSGLVAQAWEFKLNFRSQAFPGTVNPKLRFRSRSFSELQAETLNPFNLLECR